MFRSLDSSRLFKQTCGSIVLMKKLARIGWLPLFWMTSVGWCVGRKHTKLLKLGVAGDYELATFTVRKCFVSVRGLR